MTIFLSSDTIKRKKWRLLVIVRSVLLDAKVDMDWRQVFNGNRNRNRHQNGAQRLESDKTACGTRNETLPKPETESKSVEEQALSKPVILNKVLSFLDDAGDLLNCRAVCSDWKFTATEILLKRRSLTIHFRYAEKAQAYFKSRGKSCFYSEDSSSPMYYKKYGEKTLLKNLFRLIKSGSREGEKFPCVSFKISGGDLETGDIFSLFHLYGEKVENLELRFQSYCEKRSGRSSNFQDFQNFQDFLPQVSPVRFFLCRLLPNLKELEIEGMEKYAPPSEKPSLDLRLKPHENFTFHHLFQEFELESTRTETGISETNEEEPKKKMMIISQLPKLEKLFIQISDYHNFHRFYPETKNPPKNVIQQNLFDSKAVEFYGLSHSNWSCAECVAALTSPNHVGKLKHLEINALGLDLMEKTMTTIGKSNCQSQLKYSELVIDFFDVDAVKQLIKDQSMKKRMIRVLNNIFNSAANSSALNGISVHIKGPIGFLSDANFDFEIPVMENVTTLNLSKPQAQVEKADERELQTQFSTEENQSDQNLNLADIPFFPSSFNLSHSFPNLRSLSLFDWTGDFSSDLLGSNSKSQVLPSVKELHMTNFGPFKTGGGSKLPEIFPNLTRIQVELVTDFPAVAPCFWKFKELEELSIKINVGLSVAGDSNSNCNSNEMGAIDSAITGFTMETCQKLRESEEFLKLVRKAAAKWNHSDSGISAWFWEVFEWAKINVPKIKIKKKGGQNGHPFDSIEIESLRVNPSIRDLQKLTRFSIRFWDEDLSRKESYSLISELSGLFAFRLMPQLQVHLNPSASHFQNIQGMRNNLEHMKPYINSLDCYS